MGYDSDSPSNDGRDEDDEDEYEEPAGGNHLLGFMFGNVDGSGDLDVDYLDEDAKEHFAALADKLGSSLKDIDLSVKSLQTPSDATDQDYDRKAENAVDYEDFDEQYEGPEVQAATEEDFLLPKKDFFTTEVSATTLENRTSIFDDENYDEDDDDMEKQNMVVESKTENYDENMAEKQNRTSVFDDENYDVDDDMEKQNMVVESNIEPQQYSTPVEQKDSQEVLSQQGSLPEDMHTQPLEIVNLDNVESEEDDSYSSDDSMDGDKSSLLPILCVEDGKAILRFSEIFGIQEPVRKREKRDCRYTTHKEKYKSMDVSDIVEEDEDNFLKGPCHDFSWMRRWHMKSDNVTKDEVEDSVKSEIGNTSLRVDHRKDSCASSEPMKDDSSMSRYPESKSPFSSNFYSLDQQDWEDKIIWNNSPLSSENFVESCELSGPDSDTVADKERDLEAETQTLEPEIKSEPHDKDRSSFLKSCSILVEPFDANRYSHYMDFSTSENRNHPQLLRLESRVDKDNINTEGANDALAEAKLRSDAIRRFSQLTLQNKDILDGSWLDDIVWEPHQPVAKPKLILDLQDEQMLFELSDIKDSNNLQLHAGAMIISAHPNSGDSLEVHGQGTLSAGRFNISNDKFYSNRKSSQQLRSHSKKRAIHGLKVLHSVPALKLQTMKAKLSNKDVANFHRPKALWYPHDIEVPLGELGKLATQGPIKIIMKSLGGKGSKLHVDAEETILSVKAKASKKLDFKLSEPVKIIYSGKALEDDKSLAEQSVRPNSVLHLIRTKIHMLPRAQKVPGENKSRRPPGAFKKKSDLSVKDGHVFLMEYCEERPLLLGNAGMGARLCTYYQKSASGDQTGNLLRTENKGLGSIVFLDPADKSPFLGDIKPDSSQSCIETNMYRAPIFQHKVSSTDYLLVRSAKGKLSIRRIDRIDVVGQQEPHIEVMSPGSKNVQFYIMNRLLVHMYREFRASEKRGVRPSIRSDELLSQFPSLSDAFLRKRLKSCADQQKGPTGHLQWVMKRGFRIPSEEELRRMVTPESVCAYESMQAGLYRLKRLGITRLTLPTGLSSAMNQVPDEAITLAAASHIERELQITPWNLSSNFVSCTNQDRENIERLEITGVGDPSGRGLGFSYVRSIPKAPVSNPLVKKKTTVGKGSTVTGTDADLRRLSMEAARELLLKFNVGEEHIAKLTRWHRIALIRKLSSEQAASGVKVDPTTVSKFARGQRMSFLQLQQQTREKCQEVWDRQIQSLRSADGEEMESESEANSDLDSFAGDLENLLDAEAFEDGEEDNFDSKYDTVDGVKGLKMRRRPLETQAEEENEDEAAEAAELCKMLMDNDDEADQKKNKKTRAVVEQSGLAIKSKFGPENTTGVKKNNAFAKRIVQPESSYLSTESIARDQKEVESYSAKKNLTGKVKAKKKVEIEQMGILTKKVKILGDGISAIKEKKSARDSFVCGACGQLGHMRTNKNCPKYGEESDTRAESIDLEKPFGGTNFVDYQAEQKLPPKKLVPKTLTKVETPEEDKPISKAKVLKVKCGATDKLPGKLISPISQNSDRPFMVDVELGNTSVVKVNKIVFSNKNKVEDVRIDSHKPTIVIKPPVDAEKDQPRKKIIIKQPKEKEIFNLDDSQDGSFGYDDYRKTKKITELSNYEESSRMRDSVGGNLRWVEDNRRNADRQQEERYRRPEKMRMIDEQPKRNINMYVDSIRKEREEEALERQRDYAKKQKKRKPEMRDDYLDDLPSRRNDRRMPERDRIARRNPTPEYGNQLGYTQPTKRRRGGKVDLANILEGIVDSLRQRTEISYLFLKPVTKKEAPDYLKIIKRPMDLSTIKEKVRSMVYINREEFRHDVYQIAYNAHKYNDGKNPDIPPLADQVLELCDFMLDHHSRSLTEAETGFD